MAVSENLRKEMTRQHYKIVGRHSAVKLCGWLKKSIRGEGVCYKQKFYGIESHRCLQMTPWLGCPNFCRFCWRTIEKNPSKFEGVDEPSEILEESIKAQKLLINGYPGWENTDMKKWKEANSPNNAAISLTGEPTLYPKIAGLLEEFRKRKFTTFLVTNGQYPERLEFLASKQEPTQLYISIDAPDRASYRRMDRPSLKDFWKRHLRSLELMKSFSCRKVLRLTLLKDAGKNKGNMMSPEGYAKLVNLANPDFLELKAYMHVGESQKRLPREAMPLHQDVRDFASRVSEECGYPVRDEQEASRVLLLSRKG
jgi:tRNA wybutosine-synthesizing protein 1